MCDITFNAFADILDIICSFPYLQSVALDESTVELESSSVEKSARIQNKVLPSFVNGCVAVVDGGAYYERFCCGCYM
jgi:hypothetical protein